MKKKKITSLDLKEISFKSHIVGVEGDTPYVYSGIPLIKTIRTSGSSGLTIRINDNKIDTDFLMRVTIFNWGLSGNLNEIILKFRIRTDGLLGYIDVLNRSSTLNAPDVALDNHGFPVVSIPATFRSYFIIEELMPRVGFNVF